MKIKEILKIERENTDSIILLKEGLIWSIKTNHNSVIIINKLNLNFMRRLFLVVGLGFAFLGANAQTASPELVSSSGDNFSNATYQLDWSVGECVTATHSAGEYVITQGFHQNTYVITPVEDLRADIEISVYPNPTNDLVTIDFPLSEGHGNVKIIVTELSGKVLQTAEMQSDLAQINFSAYANGTYLITISQNNQLIKSFQIIKN